MSDTAKLTRRSLLELSALGAGASLLTAGLPGVSHAQGMGKVDPSIVAAAAKERRLTLLLQTSATDENMVDIIKKFKGHYPFIDVSYTMQNTIQVMNRFTSEINAKKGVSDCIMLPSNLVETDKYIASGAVAKYVISQDAAYPDAAKRSGLWYAMSCERATTIYRKGALSDQEKRLIRTYKGLGDPRFKGRIGINAVANSVSVTGAYVLLNQSDKSLWQRLVANKPRVKTASPALMDGLLSGEYDVSLFGSYASAATQARNGAPIEFVNTELTPTLFVPSGISAVAPHPNAARLWQDWITSKEGQDSWVKAVGVNSARTDVIRPWVTQQPWFFDNPPTHKPIDWADFTKKQPEVVARFKKDFQSG